MAGYVNELTEFENGLELHPVIAYGKDRQQVAVPG
jgi:hypothetical protein